MSAGILRNISHLNKNVSTLKWNSIIFFFIFFDHYVNHTVSFTTYMKIEWILKIIAKSKQNIYKFNVIGRSLLTKTSKFIAIENEHSWDITFRPGKIRLVLSEFQIKFFRRFARVSFIQCWLRVWASQLRSRREPHSRFHLAFFSQNFCVLNISQTNYDFFTERFKRKNSVVSNKLFSTKVHEIQKNWFKYFFIIPNEISCHSFETHRFMNQAYHHLY